MNNELNILFYLLQNERTASLGLTHPYSYEDIPIIPFQNK